MTCSKAPNGKKYASRAVRKSKIEGKGSAYKKEYCSWAICDYRSYWPEMPEKYRRK